jgi:hypothetical protein
MARPQKNNLDYFSHDKDMRNDLKIKALRRKFGHKGYSIYVMMLEHLSDCDYLQYEWNDLSIELLTPDFDIDSDELKEIINYCVFLKLFQVEEGYIFSEKFYQRNQDILNTRKGFSLFNSPLSVLKRNKPPDNGVNPELTTVNEELIHKEKERKQKESKEEERKEEESKQKESKGQESTLKEYQRTMLKDVINDLTLPDAVKYSLECMIDGVSTITQQDKVFEYETTLNKIAGIKQFLENFKK